MGSRGDDVGPDCGDKIEISEKEFEGFKSLTIEAMQLKKEVARLKDELSSAKKTANFFRGELDKKLAK